MKKILAIAIVTIMTFALCIGASATINVDKLGINDTEYRGGADNFRDSNPIEIAVGDKIYLLGWAYGTAHLTKLVWSVDDGADHECSNNYRDRYEITPILGIDEALGENAGFGHDTNDQGGMLELIGIDQLKDGTYKLTVKAIFADDSTETKDYNLKVGTGVNAEDPEPSQPATEKSDDQWLGGSEPGGNATGWWMNPISDGCDKYININFKAAGNFSGIHGFYLCNPAAAEVGPTVVKAQILKDGSVLAEKEIPVDGDAWYDTDFGKSFPAGDYTLSFLPVSGNGGWFVLGSYDGQGEWTIDTNCATNGDTKTHPEIMLIGAAAPSQGGDTTPTNPGTADASVIAIAAVACIALAGVVVAKKVR